MNTIKKLIKKYHSKYNLPIPMFWSVENKLPSALAFIFVLFSLQSYSQYVPPIGIPSPQFGIDESAPAAPEEWPGASVAGYYYVDNTHANATDSDNKYGYPNQPRMTIPSDRDFPAGTYIELHGTDLKFTARYAFAGTAENPCWIRGTPDNMPKILERLELSNASYLLVEYLDFNGGSGGAISIIGDNTHHISIRNSSFQNRTFESSSSAINIVPFNGGTVNDIVIYNNLFRELGDWQTEIDQDFHGVNPNLWGRDNTAEEYNIWVLDNEFYHISGNGVQANAGNWTDSYKYLHHLYIGRNVGHDNRQASFWSKQASDIIMSQNIAYGARSHGPQPGDGIGFQYGPNNLWIIFNEIYDNNYGIRQSSTGAGAAGNKVYILGNMIRDGFVQPGIMHQGSGTGWGISLWQGHMERYIHDNTIYNVSGGITSVADGPISMSNNIISELYDGGSFVGLNLPATNSASIDNNIFYDTEGITGFGWGSNYSDLASFKTATGDCANCMVVDPKFTSLENNRFRLQDDSPAIDAGIKPDAYQVFFDLYGININVDYYRNPRPLGNAWDIGAFEHGTPLSLTDKDIGNTISIFPNPTSDIFTIDLKGEVLENVVVYNGLGQKIKEATIKEVNISNIPEGIYLVKIAFKNGKTTTKKLLKN